MAGRSGDVRVFEQLIGYWLNHASSKATKKLEKQIASKVGKLFQGTRILLGSPLFRKILLDKVAQNVNILGIMGGLFCRIDIVTGADLGETLSEELDFVWKLENSEDPEAWRQKALDFIEGGKTKGWELFRAYWIYRALYRAVGTEDLDDANADENRKRFFLLYCMITGIAWTQSQSNFKVEDLQRPPELTDEVVTALGEVFHIENPDTFKIFFCLTYERASQTALRTGVLYFYAMKMAYVIPQKEQDPYPQTRRRKPAVAVTPETFEAYKKKFLDWSVRPVKDLENDLESEALGKPYLYVLLSDARCNIRFTDFEEAGLNADERSALRTLVLPYFDERALNDSSSGDMAEQMLKASLEDRDLRETLGLLGLSKERLEELVVQKKEELELLKNPKKTDESADVATVPESQPIEASVPVEAIESTHANQTPEPDKQAESMATHLQASPQTEAVVTKLEARAQYVFEDEVARTLVFPSKEKIAKRPHPVSNHYRRFLGRLVQLGTFYNLLIHAEEVNGVFAPVNMEEIRALYPKHGAFNVRSSARKKFIDGGYYVIDLERDDLEHNINSTTNARREDYEYMVNYERLNRDKRFYQASDFGLYMVVHPEDPQCALDQTIFVCLGDDNKTFLNQGVDFQVLVKVGDKFLGPVTLRRNAQNRPYVNFATGTSNGVISAFVQKAEVRPSTIEWEEWNMVGEKAHFETVEMIDVHSLTPIQYDVMTDEWLLRKLVGQVTNERGARDSLYDWAKNQHEADDLFSGDKAVREARYARLLSILSRDQENERFYTDVARLVSSSLLRLDEESDLFDAIAKQVVEKTEYKERLESHQLIASELSQQRRRLENARLEAEEVERTTKEKRESLEGEIKTRHKRLTSEVERLQAQVEQQRQTLAHIEEGASIEGYVDELRHHITTMSEQKKLFEDELVGIGEKLKESVKEYRKYAFDGMLANQFLEAASQWQHNDEEERREQRQASIRAIKPSDLSGQALMMHVLKSVKAVRRYQSNDILNIFIAITQNFLTVFSGPPGLGKTSMCNLVGKVLGLNLVGGPDGESSRYLPISVERGWTGKRDLVGYWNPLTKSFESVDMRRYEAFRQLDSEAREKKNHLPFVMLLDEANLSPMEYYWADFMNLCDEHGEESHISLGDKRTCMIPETLRFVATINNDHTTETLSPRLIDRAMVVTLPELGWRGLMSDDRPEADVSPDFIVSWQALKELFGPKPINRDQADIEECLEAVFNQMAKGGFHLSQRVHRATQHYISAAMSLFEKGNYPSTTVVAIDYAVAQKVLPHIEGHGPQFEAWLRELENVLGQYGLEKSKKEVERILLIGEAKMKYFRFFN